jgi:hypothetical protein
VNSRCSKSLELLPNVWRPIELAWEGVGSPSRYLPESARQRRLILEIFLHLRLSGWRPVRPITILRAEAARLQSLRSTIARPSPFNRPQKRDYSVLWAAAIRLSGLLINRVKSR